MDQWWITVCAVIGAIAGSSGFWAFMQKRANCKDASRIMLLGLAHNTIMSLCIFYLRRKWMTVEEHENLIKYLYEPYVALGGNGSATRLVTEVNNKVEIRQYGPHEEEEYEYVV